MNTPKVTSDDARQILKACKVNIFEDFFSLESSRVDLLVWYAKARGYRKPKNANGSTGRYFHAYLVRQAQKED